MKLCFGVLIQTTAQGWLILQLTDSPFYLGLDGLCMGVPRVLFSPLGGAMVDRMNRRFLFIFTQSALLLMTLFLGLMNYSGLIHVWNPHLRQAVAIGETSPVTKES